MEFSVNDYLNAIRPHLPQALIDGQALADIAAVAQQVPGPTTSFFGFECRLSHADAKADFLLCARSDEAGRKILAGHNEVWGFPQHFFSDHVWQRIQTFCRRWANPQSPLHQKVHNVWLEFDLEEPPSPLPVPSFFFGTDNTLRSSVSADCHRWLTEHALHPLFDATLSTVVKEQLLACVTALPAQAYVFQVGAMLARPSEAVRICIRDIASDAIIDYLGEIGWPGSMPGLSTLVSDLRDRVDRIDLDLDIGDRVFPKIGLECYCEYPPMADARQKAFLDYLVHRRLCRSAKRDALLQYPGRNHAGANHDAWPKYLLKSLERLEPRKLSVISRLIHHIKIVYQPELPLEAKAYLAVSHDWIDERVLEAARIWKYLTGDATQRRAAPHEECHRIKDFLMGQNPPQKLPASEHGSVNGLLAQAMTAYRSGRSRMFAMFLQDSHDLFRETYQNRIKERLADSEHEVYVQVRDTVRRGVQLTAQALFDESEECFRQASADLSARASSDQVLLLGKSYIQQAEAYLASRLKLWDRARQNLLEALETDRVLEYDYDFQLCHVLRVHLVHLLMRVEVGAGELQTAINLANQVDQYVLGNVDELPAGNGWSQLRMARAPEVFRRALLARSASEVGALLAHRNPSDAGILFASYPSWRAFSEHDFLHEIYAWGRTKEALPAGDTRAFLRRCGRFLQAGRGNTTLWYAVVHDLCTCCQRLRPAQTIAFRSEVAGDAQRWQSLPIDQFPTAYRSLLAQQGKGKDASGGKVKTRSRRFRAYNVGLPRTGTNSIAALFGNYRSAAEFMKWETVERIVAAHSKTISPQEFQAFLLERDQAGDLEMDSASFNHFYLDVLVESFPDAKFTFTIRDCYTWTNSFLGLLLNWRTKFDRQGVNPPHWMAAYGRVMFGTFDWSVFSSRQTLRANVPSLVEGFVRCWSTYNLRVLESLPPERSLIIRTDELSNRLDELAEFVGVPRASLTHDHHANRSADPLDLLSGFDRSQFDALCAQHGGNTVKLPTASLLARSVR